MTTLMRYRHTGLLVTLLLTGCAIHTAPAPRVTPDATLTTIPAITPSATAAVKPQLSIDRWWLLFNDPQLTRLIDEALARNEDLEAAVARVREAQAALEIADAARSPALEAHGQNGRKQQSTVAAMPLPPGVDRRASSHQLSLAASYELDLWGKLASASEAARQQVLAAEWARATVEWGLTARLAEAYFGLAAVDRQIAISEAVRASRATTLKLRQREHEAGAGNEFDLRRSEAELTSTDATMASLQLRRIALERALTALLGRTPAELAGGNVFRAAIDESKSLIAVLPQGSAAELIVRRPDVRQIESQLAAANASIEAARAATLPSVQLSGIIGSDARSLSNLFSGPALIWSLAVSASQLLADGGRGKARVREEHARAGQALANYRKAIAGAVLDVREAYANLDMTQQALDAERARVAALARARDLARLGYDNGAMNYLDLLDAERNWYQAQLDQVSAYRDRLVGQVAAFKALGGGYATEAMRAQAY